MKKFITLFFVLIFICTILFSQSNDFILFKSKADSCIKIGDYFLALKYYNAAEVLKLKKDEKNELLNLKNKTQELIKQQYFDLQIEKLKNDSLLSYIQNSNFDKGINIEKNYYGDYDYLNILEIDLSYTNIKYLPVEVSKCENLRKINLIGNPNLDYDSIFNVIKTLPMITDIKISIDSLNQIPKDYQKWLTGVKYNKHLIEFPKEILMLTNLNYIDLSGTEKNKNTIDLSKIEFNYPYLNTLILEYCNLNFLPENISLLKNLEILKLKGNNLTNLPKSFVVISNLKILGIESNNFSNLPLEIFKLSKLEILSAYNNKIEIIPSDIKNLSNLKTLYLWDNKISIIPNEICALNKITDLRLNKNSISELNPKVFCLNELVFLDISNNFITYIPNEISTLYNLESLNLNNNKIEKFITQITFLKKLKSLNLGNNKISILPIEIKNLENLQNLDLSNNNIKELPIEIAKLNSLVDLNIDNNQLITIPDELSNQKKLLYISFENNKFTEQENLRLINLYSKNSVVNHKSKKANVEQSNKQDKIQIKDKKIALDDISNLPANEDNITLKMKNESINLVFNHFITPVDYKTYNIEFSFLFPQFYFDPKAIVRISPYILFDDNSEIFLGVFTFEGEKIKGNNHKVMYKNGRNFKTYGKLFYSDKDVNKARLYYIVKVNHKKKYSFFVYPYRFKK